MSKSTDADEASVRAVGVPNANSPELLTHLLEVIARGVRSPRALQEALGVDLRTVQYYLQAGVWLGFLQDEDRPVLSPVGLEYVYAGPARGQVYADAVAAHPQLSHLLDAGPEGPTREAVVRWISRVAPDLAESTVERRVSAVRGLLAPALENRREALEGEGAQLDLPLAQRTTVEAAPPLTRLSGRSFSPDVYRYLLCVLLDHGELTLGHVRGLLDRAGAKDVAIGPYVDLATTRGDAVRVDERLVVTGGAVARRGLTDSTAAIILSDDGWRRHVDDVRSLAARAEGTVRVGGAWRLWNERLFGHALSVQSLDADLQRVLRDRSLASFPRTDPLPPAPPVVRERPFLEVWTEPGLVVALPPSLAQLWEGLSGVNRRLRNARHRADAVGTPTLAYRPVAVHGGLLHPGEATPRAVPDHRTLRLRLVQCAPYPCLVVALLLAHRRRGAACEVRHVAGGWVVQRGRRELGGLLEVLDAFALRQGWVPSRREQGGLEAHMLLGLLQRLGLIVALDARAVLDDTFFQQLGDEIDEGELRVRLEPLAVALSEHVAHLHARVPGRA